MPSSSFVNLNRVRRQKAAEEAKATATSTVTSSIATPSAQTQSQNQQNQQQQQQQSISPVPSLHQQPQLHLDPTHSSSSSQSASSVLVSPIESTPNTTVFRSPASYSSQGSLSPASSCSLNIGGLNSPLSPTATTTISGHPWAISPSAYTGGGGGSSDIRRHQSTGSRHKKYLSSTQAESLGEEAEEEDEGDGEEGGKDGKESKTAALGGLTRSGLDRMGNLTRHGSLPSKNSAFQARATRAGIKAQTSPGVSRLDSITAYSPVGPTQTKGVDPQDDKIWEQALAEKKRAETMESNSPSTFSNSVLRHQRSLQLIPSGSRSQHTPLSPTSTVPGSASLVGGHARSASGTGEHVNENSQAEVEASLRRHQSLTQQGMNTRISDRLKASPLPLSNTQRPYPASSSASHSVLSAPEDQDLPPPTSPIQASPWGNQGAGSNSISSNLSWEDHSRVLNAGSLLSPVPGSARFGAVIRRMEEEADGGLGGVPAMNAEQLQTAFEAASLGRSSGAHNALGPPVVDLGRLSPDLPGGNLRRSQSLRTHSRTSSRSHDQAALGGNPPPPRFLNASPQPPSTSPRPDEPSFSASPEPQSLSTGSTAGSAYNSFRPTSGSGSSTPSLPGGKKLSLLTDPVTLGQISGQKKPSGPATAAPYVPPIGHTTRPPQSALPGKTYVPGSQYAKPYTAVGMGWDQKHAIIGSRSGGALNGDASGEEDEGGIYTTGQGDYLGRSLGPMIQPTSIGGMGGPIPHQLLQAQMNAFTGGNPSGGIYPIPLLPPITQSLAGPTGGYLQPIMGVNHGVNFSGPGGNPVFLRAQTGLPEASGHLDVQGLIQAKGYNPPVFDINPTKAKFFVIKSYTEDDVAKSLKFEIWASTRYGNARLDKAFKEHASTMPIYLMFSVNSSGHFAGIAQMITDVDYSTTSTVWAQDKWKGIFRVKWIYVKDVPNQALRHIRLTNTSENKPVTNSRDTQELPFEAGLEMLQIFHTYQARTSLLQDYGYYELASNQRDISPHNQQHHREPPVEKVWHPAAVHLPSFPAQPTVYTARSGLGPGPGPGPGLGQGQGQSFGMGQPQGPALGYGPPRY
ncbi:Uncharacterized high-glucose-regulated protein [Phaffia rhodozyma]|uniref:Uncharacterized high-glucose-regulated protein n=1 Tax=Phaffia rhodozyma TaxID=264483 RepID=A0A0F7SKV4_PHARH|nr:Uncharacterized high-glucose-regulated protein [Phaffia rhodozyma]